MKNTFIPVDTISASRFIELGRFPFIYRFVNYEHKVSPLLYVLCDDYTSTGEKYFKFIMPQDMPEFIKAGRVANHSKQISLTRKILADNVKFVQKGILN